MVATFRTKNKSLSKAAVEILEIEKPMTLRQLFYRCVSAGLLQNKQTEYKRLGQVMTRVRESGEVPFEWMVDNIRSTIKPSSWSGLEDFGETVRRVYRKDFWARQLHHVEVFVEKDAIAGTIQPITYDVFDVALQVCRGYGSLSFVGGIASNWRRIEKPIHAYYLGDYDPSGFDIERDLKEKLRRYSGRTFHWTRLAVRESDFDDFDLIELPVKDSDKRARAFRETHGDRCAEVDAIAPTELRRRVEAAIESHVDLDEWARIHEVERLEKREVSEWFARK
ncbi:MAG: hypothetical protein KF873_19295 [Gemmataceae bacterium]|nr:hypothetical protein [Gemmataceae bacterium]